MELRLLTDRCSENLDKKIKNRINDLKEFPSGRPAFFIYIFLILLSAYGFSNSIPWSSEAETVLYYNAPSSWVLGFENIKGLYKAVKEFRVEKQKRLFIEEFSKRYNLDSGVIEKFFESRIVIISDEAFSFSFQDFFHNIFHVNDFLEHFFTEHEKNIICIEQFDGLEVLMNIISGFTVKSRVFGDFIAFSSDEDYLEKQFQIMLNRNEFSKDVIFYSESNQENIEITNAYSFLNFERKELMGSRETLSSPGEKTQFLLDNIYIPFRFDHPDFFEINSSNEIKEYFYDNFEVYSSIGEWLSVFELLEKGVIYSFLFKKDSRWLLGFSCDEALLENRIWQRYISSWGLNTKNSIKPFADDYFLSLYDNHFLISTDEVEKIDENNQIISEMMTKFERNMLLKAEVIDQNYNADVSTIEIYHFSYIDDKIIKNLFRIF